LAFQFIPNSGTILQSAAQCGNIESFDILIEHGAVFSNGSLVHAAVKGGSLEMIRHVMELGGSVDEQDSFNTMGYSASWGSCGLPLLRAIGDGKTEVVRILLEKGADCKMQRHRDGMTALEMVKKNWVLSDIRYLVEEAEDRRNREGKK
jgi:hypothetical protein